MASTNRRKSRPGVTLAWLFALTAVLFGAVGLGALTSDGTWTPKLALDLEGGTQIILQPTATDGSKVTSEAIDEAIDVIRQRVDSSGVSEAQITSQGSNNIVVSIPGHPSQDTIDLVSQSAQMRFRAVVYYGAPNSTSDGGTIAATPAPTATSSPASTAKNSAFERDDADRAAEIGSAVYTKGSSEVREVASTPSPTTDATDAGTDDGTATTDATTFDQLVNAQITDPAEQAEVKKQYDALDCTDPENRTGGGGDAADKPLVACDNTGAQKFVLGPVEIEGTEIKSASSGIETNSQGVSTGQWVVDMKFTSTGSKQFEATTKRIAALTSPQNQFAMVLDGLVIEAPSVDSKYSETGITGGSAQISGSFTRQSAATLANQLNFGALPLTFEVQSQQQVSATLGSEQLEKGLLAGLIGLVLVVVYSMFQYRLLGLLTIASLVVAAVLTYGVISLLSWRMGYRLSLPGVAGLIVAIGFTADSFIVYFERIRDELRDGRPLAGAVERGWERARRTVLAAKTVNLISAVVLYYLAVGGVQGFAFTLGLTVIIDVVVVFWFTHPVMELLSRRPYFRDGHKGSGLSPDTYRITTVRYKGAGRFETASGAAAQAGAADDAPEPELAVPEEPSADELVGAARDRGSSAARAAGGPPPVAPDGHRMTIAERRAAERAAAAGQDASDDATNEENH